MEKIWNQRKKQKEIVRTMSRAIKKMLSIREIMFTQSAKPVIYCDSACAFSPFCSDASTWFCSLITSCDAAGDSRSEVSGEDEDGKLPSG